MTQIIGSFKTIKHVDMPVEFDTDICEKLKIAEIDGQKYLITIRNKALQGKTIAEITMYDLDLNLKASYSWNGDAMDFQVAEINGYTRIIVAGKETNPTIKILDTNLNPIANVSWELQPNFYGTAKCLFVSDNPDIVVLSVVEGNKVDEGYIQIRIYDENLQLKKITRWSYPNGKVVKWGHYLTSIDIDNDGKDELIALINFERNGIKRSELRILDNNLAIKRLSFIPESIFATCMTVGDIDNDDKNEIIIGGEVFSGRWQGATNQIAILDNELNEKNKTSWKTFRHSWLWDMQVADIDNDGKKEIITYGGTSITGKNQNEANTIGEISVYNGKTLDVKDIFLWQTASFNDTRPSRGVFFQNDDSLCLAVTTSKWVNTQRTNKLEIRLFEYKHNPIALKQWIEFIDACNEKNSKKLANYADPDYVFFAPIVLEALAFCGDEKSIELMGNYLATQDKSLFIRTAHLLQNFGKGSVEQLRKVGFSIQNDWLIASPFDNTDNKGFDMVYPPEIETDFSAFYAGKGRIVRWGKTAENIWDDRRWNIYSDLNYIYFDGFERTGIEHGWNILNLKSIGYALTYVESPETTKAEIRLGSAGGIKIWFNGDLIYKNDLDRSPEIDQDIIPISLRKGKNKIMLKVAGKNENGWGFFFRITGKNGEQINGLEYKQPETDFFHNEILTYRQLSKLIESNDEWLKYYAGVELMSVGDKRGNETLVSLLNANDDCVRANSALSLTSEDDRRGIETLVELAPKQDPLFQFSAGNVLERIGDHRAEQFSIYNVKDENGNNLISMDIDDREYGFYLCPRYKGDDTAHVNVRTNLLFHLGENVSAKCAIIMSFGIRETSYRAMGIGRTALKKACDQIAEMGHSCTIVSTGIKLVAHRLYCQCGFYDRRDHWRFEKHVDKLRDNETDILIRNYENFDKDNLLMLREQYMLNSIGPNTWSPRDSFDPERIKVAECDDKIIGYAEVSLSPFDPLVEIDFLHIDEDFDNKKMALKALLGGIDKYALSEGKNHINFLHPSPYMKDILISDGYNLDSSYMRHEWIGMFRINNLKNYLDEILPLLISRINKSKHAGLKASLAINGSQLKATMLFEDGIINIEDGFFNKADVILSADDRILTQIFTSNGNIWELYRQNILTIKPSFNERIRTLLEVLFPIMPCRMGGWWC